MHTGELSKAITAKGHDVTTCDLKQGEFPERHIQGDVLNILDSRWDFMIAFPPCTYLAKAQEWRCQRESGREQKQQAAIEFATALFNAPIPRIAIENPVGKLSQVWGAPSQIVRPWWFGDPYQKEICLWFSNVPPLIATLYNPIRKPIANHVNSRMTQAQKSEVKSSWNYYPGMCKAIADQWFSESSTSPQGAAPG